MKKSSKLISIMTELNCTVDDLEELIERFSKLRFMLLDRAENGDEEAKKLYEGWTRKMHLHLGNAMEQKP